MTTNCIPTINGWSIYVILTYVQVFDFDEHFSWLSVYPLNQPTSLPVENVEMKTALSENLFQVLYLLIFYFFH